MNFNNLKLRPSELGRVMAGFAKPSLTEKQLSTLNELQAKGSKSKQLDELIAKQNAQPELSQGGKTYVKEIVDKMVYGYTDRIENKYFDKGLTCELEAIEYLNSNLFTNYEKFEEGKYENEWLVSSGCDIKQNEITRDIKCSWSKKTHPKRYIDAIDPLYEWQGRAYMMLFGSKVHYVDHILMDTPSELIGYEHESLHDVSNLSFELRHTSVKYEYDQTLNDLIIEAVKEVRKFASEYYLSLKNTKNYEN